MAANEEAFLNPQIGKSLASPLKVEPAPGWIGRTFYGRRPISRYVVIAVSIIGVFFIATSIQGYLWIYNGTPLSFTLHKARVPGRELRIPLGLDAAGLIFIVAAALKPVFCARQVELIRRYSEANRDNSVWRHGGPEVAVVNAQIKAANDAFAVIARRWTSALMLVAAAGATGVMYWLISRAGPLAAWNPSTLNRAQWVRLTYHGWWANIGERPVLGLLLCAASTYYLYFLFKQLWMGFVFAKFARRASQGGFGVVPNLVHNSDGFWGLLSLRRFMQWTYFSTVIDFTNTLCTFLLWLPFSQLTVLVGLTVIALNIATVTYPTSLAFDSAVVMKGEYAQLLIARSAEIGQLAPGLRDVDAELTRLWAEPTLPFRTRASVAALAVYLLAPLILAVVSSLALPTGK